MTKEQLDEAKMLLSAAYIYLDNEELKKQIEKFLDQLKSEGL